MPWKLIGFLICLSLILLFVGFNLQNTSDITLWFDNGIVIKSVPVFVIITTSYVIGALTTIPIMYFQFRRKKKKWQKHTKE